MRCLNCDQETYYHQDGICENCLREMEMAGPTGNEEGRVVVGRNMLLQNSWVDGVQPDDEDILANFASSDREGSASYWRNVFLVVLVMALIVFLGTRS